MSANETRCRGKLSPETVGNRHENHANGFSCKQTDENKASAEKRLYKLEEIPEYLRFNPFVKNGYRRQMNVKECCRSLLFFHNETVNIYTHGKFICSVYFIQKPFNVDSLNRGTLRTLYELLNYIREPPMHDKVAS